MGSLRSAAERVRLCGVPSQALGWAVPPFFGQVNALSKAPVRDANSAGNSPGQNCPQRRGTRGSHLGRDRGAGGVEGQEVVRGGWVDREERMPVLLAAIAGFWRRNGYGPSVRDLARVVGTESTATVHYWLVALEAEGVITKVLGVARSVRVVG